MTSKPAEAAINQLRQSLTDIAKRITDIREGPLYSLMAITTGDQATRHLRDIRIMLDAAATDIMRSEIALLKVGKDEIQ